jgi:hypothetical protein
MKRGLVEKDSLYRSKLRYEYVLFNHLDGFAQSIRGQSEVAVLFRATKEHVRGKKG